MSRTNTAAYESIKASQIVFQNPDRTFPEPGAVLAIDNLRGATTWSRNLDVDSMTLSGSSSTGVLTYDNQLLVNGNPVGGSGSGLSSGYNITVAGGAVNMDIQHDVSMNRNSIQDCSSITIVGQYGSPGTFRSIGTDIQLNKPLMVASSPFGRLILKGTGTPQSSLTFDESDKKLTFLSPSYEFKTSAGEDNIIVIDASGQLYIDVSAGSFANVLGYDVATGAVRYQAAGGGGSDLSGGYNISVGSGVVNMNITQPVLMNNNPVVNASYVDISAGGDSARLSYITLSSTLRNTKHFEIYGVDDPTIRLYDVTTQQNGNIQYNISQNKISMTAENVAIVSNYGSQAINTLGATLTSYNKRIWWNVYDPPNVVMKSSLELSTANKLIIGSIDVSLNPVLVFQGGKAPDSEFDTKASIEYFDASGVEQLRFTSKNYAFNAVPSGSLPNVLGYDTSSGEIKAQSAGLAPITAYSYDASGSSITYKSSVSVGTEFIPSSSGIYLITYSVSLSNSASTAIQIINNNFEAFQLDISQGTTSYSKTRISCIQNRANAGSAPITTDVYTTSFSELLNAGSTYKFNVKHDDTSIIQPNSPQSTWASCIPRVRIVKMC